MPALRIAPQPGVRFLGGGTAYPDRVLDNEAVLRWLEPDRDPRRLAFAAEGIEQTLGVRERAWARWPGDPSSDQTDTVDLAVCAAQVALTDAGIAATDVDVMLIASSTPTRWTSTLSSSVGGRLGVRAMSFDVRSGCAGALFALATASMYLNNGASRVLVVGADTFSKAIPRGDKMSALLLADGAAAVVLGRGEGALLGGAMLSDGSLGHHVHTPGPLPPTHDAIDNQAYALHGDPDALVEAVPGLYAEVIEGALSRSGVQASTLDRYIPQQAGRPVIEAACQKLGLSLEQAYERVGRHGNTGAASALGALVEARADGFLQDGHHTLIAAVGGGMSAAALVWRC
jgi:3-oxoacyl-[acyl-carrier-protein] synthase-3